MERPAKVAAKLVIKLFALDVDGTLTDGGIYLGGNGKEFKRFNVRDGLGIKMLLQSGVKVVFISGRFSEATARRAEELGVTACLNGAGGKLEALKRILSEYGISREETAFAGDDMPDLECIKWVGLGIAVSNAVSEVRKAADVTMRAGGGYGAVREAAELILELNEDSVDRRR